jgi:hypothetical protein
LSLPRGHCCDPPLAIKQTITPTALVKRIPSGRLKVSKKTGIGSETEYLGLLPVAEGKTKLQYDPNVGLKELTDLKALPHMYAAPSAVVAYGGSELEPGAEDKLLFSGLLEVKMKSVYNVDGCDFDTLGIERDMAISGRGTTSKVREWFAPALGTFLRRESQIRTRDGNITYVDVTEVTAIRDISAIPGHP